MGGSHGGGSLSSEHGAGGMIHGAGGAPGAAASVLGHWAEDGGHGGGEHGGGEHGGGEDGGGEHSEHAHENENDGGGSSGGEHEDGGGGGGAESEGGQTPVGEIDGIGDGKSPKPAGQQKTPAEVKNNGSLAGVRGSVKLTAAIVAGYTLLQPYLPGGTQMTSGLRSDADQARIINQYFASKGGPARITDVEQKRQWLITKKKMKIARVGSSPHRTGLAFDLSGAGLGAIRRAVQKCAAEKKGRFKLANTILEPANNCLHVNLSG